MPLKHLLIVDDSKSARLVLAKMLKDLGLTVDMAASGEEALDFLRTNLPDAIFMDHTMPGMSGLQALKAIKDNPYTANIPVAMYTSKEGDTYAAQVKAQGGVGVLLKPATPSALADVIKRLTEAFEADSKPKEGEADNDMVSAQIPSQTIEIIVRKTVPLVVNEAIRTQVLPVLEEKFSKLRDEMLASSESTIMDMAAKIYDKRFDTLYRHLIQQLNTRTNELTEKLDAVKGKSDEVQKLVMSLANHDVEKATKEMVRQMEGDIVRKTNRDVEKASLFVIKRINILSGLAIVLSLIAIGMGVHRFL